MWWSIIAHSYFSLIYLALIKPQLEFDNDDYDATRSLFADSSSTSIQPAQDDVVK